MAPEIINWLRDVREHWRVSRRRAALRQPGAGIDYTQDQDTVRRVVSRIHPDRMRLRVTEIVQETPTTKTLRCERVDGPLPPFRAGQYVNVFVDVDGVLTSRPYSISSAPPSIPPAGGGERGGASPPPAGGMDLTVRDKPGGFVAPYLLNEVQVGDELETTGPAGSFYYEPLIDGDDMVFLAGGSGITPFMSIIRDALRRDLPPFDGLRAPLKIHLLYGSRVPDDVIFGDELAELADRHSNFNYTLVISEPPPGHTGDRKGRPYLTGFLDARLIREQIGDVRGKTFYICGPGLMYDFCLSALTELGVPLHRIRRELYGPPDDVTKEPGWPEGLSADAVFEVEVVNLPPAREGEEAAFGAVGQLTSVPPASGGEERGGQTIRAPAGEPLMNTLERYGVVVPAVCRSGACSACRIRLLSGRVFAPAYAGLRESDKEHGYIHACVSYPLEDLRIRI